MPDDLQIPELGKRKVFGSTLPMPGMPEVPAAAMSKTPMSLGMTPSSPPNPFDEAIQKGLAINAASSPSLPPSPLPKPPMAAAGDQPQPPGIQPKPFFSAAERNIKNPFLRKLAEVGDVAGGILAPRIESMIPGSRGAEQAAQNRELGIEKEQAGIDEAKARAAKDQASAQGEWTPIPGVTDQSGNPVEHNKVTGEYRSGGAKVQPLKPANEWAAIPGVVDKDGNPVEINKSTGETRASQGAGQVSPLKPANQTFEEQEYAEWQKTHPNGTRLQFEQERARDTQKPEREPHQLAVGPDGTVIELKPGMKVPAGTKTAAKYGEPTADEQRRADLAENLNENLKQLEDIVTRRPDLFGPMAGRFTGLKQMLGSGDPDVAALATIQHQIGMAQISAHGMRSAHGIEGAADSILNSFHNEPKAVLAAIQAARQSVSTFGQDVAKAKGEQPQGPPKVGDVVDGYRFKGGNPADQKSWEPVK